MKRDVMNILSGKGRIDIFTHERYETMKATMKMGISKDAWLKNYLSLDPLNKAQWIADHMIIFTDEGHI